MLDVDIAAAYNEAVEQAPLLVQNESKIIDFLRTEDFHVYKAAARIARYWQFRKELFGDRWLRPLNQTGSGALNSDDIVLLRTGERVLFYLLSVSTCECVQTVGLTTFHLIRGARYPFNMPKQERQNMLLASLPIKLTRVMVVKAHEEGREHLLEYRLFQQSKIIALRNSARKNLLLRSIDSDSVA
eukprot:scaffold41601_cov183-Amphora_coffeaeformis.AAC.1